MTALWLLHRTGKTGSRAAVCRDGSGLCPNSGGTSLAETREGAGEESVVVMYITQAVGLGLNCSRTIVNALLSSSVHFGVHFVCASARIMLAACRLSLSTRRGSSFHCVIPATACCTSRRRLSIGSRANSSKSSDPSRHVSDLAEANGPSEPG